MRKKLKEQVDKILDEGTGKRRGVIVRMTPPEKIDVLMRTASNAMQKRNLSLNARDVLPVSLDDMVLPKSGRRSPSAQRHIKAAKSSVASQMAMAKALEITTHTILREASLQVLEPLMASNLVKKTFDEMSRPRAKKPSKKKQPSPLWISKSMFLDISKDDLAKLPSEVSQIQGIYPNRTHRLPPIVETQ
ncbi:MAG: hypothetical protein KAV87_03425, partial [Desulfobacteraceae bacterium]|nr:hypothetical protein [Desulfobacteraceae bacterium]